MNYKLLKLVIFDLDGTLIDSNSIKKSCFLNSCENENEVSYMQSLILQSHLDRYQIYEKFSKKFYRSETQKLSLVENFNAMVKYKLALCPEMPGATPLLLSLRDKNFSVYLSTLTPTVEIAPIIQNRGWDGLFEGIVGSPQNKVQTLRSIKEKKGYENEEIVVIGDGEDDFLSAFENSVKFIPVGEGRGDHKMKVASLNMIQKAIES